MGLIFPSQRNRWGILSMCIAINIIPGLVPGFMSKHSKARSTSAIARCHQRGNQERKTKMIKIKTSSDGLLQIYSRWFYFAGFGTIIQQRFTRCHGRVLLVTPIGFIQCHGHNCWRIPSGFFLGLSSWGTIYLRFLRWDIDLNPIRKHTHVHIDTKIEIKLTRIPHVLRKAVEMGL